MNWKYSKSLNILFVSNTTHHCTHRRVYCTSIVRGLVSEGWYFVLSGVVVVLTGGLVVFTRAWLHLQESWVYLQGFGCTYRKAGCTYRRVWLYLRLWLYLQETWTYLDLDLQGCTYRWGAGSFVMWTAAWCQTRRCCFLHGCGTLVQNTGGGLRTSWT